MVSNNMRKIFFLLLLTASFSVSAMESSEANKEPAIATQRNQLKKIAMRRKAYTLAKDILDNKKSYDDLNTVPQELHNYTKLLVEAHLNFDKALQKAIKHINRYSRDDIKNLIETGANEYIKTSPYPLISAIELGILGNYWLFDLLLAHGASVNLQDKDGRTPLYHAVLLQQPYFVRALLKAGADPNILNRQNFSPLIVASGFGNRKIASLLLKYGAKVAIKGGNQKQTALSQSVQNNRVAVVKLLLDCCADPNEEIPSTDPTYTIPIIQVAAQYGFNDIIVALLQANANINLLGHGNYTTALIRAVRAKKIDTVKLLLERHADKTIRNKVGKTALDYAIDNRDPEMINLLASAELASMPELVEAP